MKSICHAGLACFLAMLPLQRAFCQEVLSSGGNSGRVNEISLSWTIGEPVVKTLTGQGAILTQGFQQGFLRSNSAQLITDQIPAFRIFPNPANDFLIVQAEKPAETGWIITIIDAYGRILHECLMNQTKIDLNVGQYSSGHYLIKIRDIANKWQHCSRLVIL
jgi:hypothetical protein